MVGHAPSFGSIDVVDGGVLSPREAVAAPSSDGVARFVAYRCSKDAVVKFSFAFETVTVQ